MVPGIDGFVAVGNVRVFVEAVQAVQQGFFEAGIAALEGLNAIQTISLYRILERGAESFVLPPQRGEPGRCYQLKPAALLRSISFTLTGTVFGTVAPQ